ncbi:MAG: peptidoglycan bridge formation glycyltransferase FemA/FemB family protein [Candidatus Moraniibacteriota bacterium]
MNTEFLQSEEWLRLQKATGKEVVPFSGDGFLANGIVHTLPLVGRYLYVPRGPKIGSMNHEAGIKNRMQRLVQIAKEKRVKWVRIEPETEELFEEIKKSVPCKVVRAPHDMQPREIFKIDISLSEETLLAQMKPKTRYNIRLAEKRGVKVFETREEKDIESFLDLITATSGRKGITSHSKEYYKKFFMALPEAMCQLFVAEYEGVIIAANIVIFYGDTVTYLHGGTSDLHRDVMAPYLLQWEQIKTAKERGYTKYDFGGVSFNTTNSWQGITKFKTGFSPQTLPTMYAGTYDIVLAPFSYTVYRVLQKVKTFFL